MSNNYSKLVHDNLDKLYKDLPDDLEKKLPGTKKDNVFIFDAFGETCRISPDGIYLTDEAQNGVLGILISLYALHVHLGPYKLEPLTAFKEFKDSMPYVGAFSNNTEKILVPYVDKIEKSQNKLIDRFNGKPASSIAGGDFSFILKPLPKIMLCYIFYAADDEFQASATCLFSSNALSFLPVDALADVGEYTSKKILDLL